MNRLRMLRRPHLDSGIVAFLVAVYLILAANRTFWMKIHAYLAAYPAAVWALYLAMTAMFVALLALFTLKYVLKPVAILLVLTASIGAWFTDSFGVVIDSDMVRNAAQTTPAEARHLLTAGFALHMVLFAVLPIALLMWVKVTYRPFLRGLLRNAAVFAVCLVIVGIAAFNFSKPYAAAIRQHKDIVKSLNPVTPIAGTVKFLMEARGDAPVTVTPLGTDARVVPVRSASGKPRVTIIIAGETARAANFSLGGYGRETNPELARQDIVYFPNTTSCGTATAVSIPCMFSVFPRSAYTHGKGTANETLLDVLAHAGIAVEWWDNNTGSKGVADRVSFTDLVVANDPRFCSLGECRDDIFLDRLDAWLDNVQKDSVLVLHMMGSHGPTYYLRYPPEFRRFTPDCATAELGDCSDAEIVNAYDNTILYTDHVLSTVIDKLKARAGQLETGMIYISDHGESLGENGLYLHGTPYALAPDFQTHVPFLVWTDSDFAASMTLDRACLKKTASEPRSQDNLFHSVLAMMNVRTGIYDQKLDLFAVCRGGVPQNGGKVSLTHDKTLL